MYILRASWKINYYMYVFMYGLNVATIKNKVFTYLLNYYLLTYFFTYLLFYLLTYLLTYLDIIVLEKCEVYSTKNPIKLLH